MFLSASQNLRLEKVTKYLAAILETEISVTKLLHTQINFIRSRKVDQR